MIQREADRSRVCAREPAVDVHTQVPPEYSCTYYYFQFFLIRGSKEQDARGWTCTAFNDWVIFSCPSIPIVRLCSVKGPQVGFLLGTAINAAGLLDHGDEVVLPPGADENSTAYERWLATIRGRYVAFIESPRLGRFDLDPMGTLGAVYAREHPAIASTWSLIKQPSDADLSSALKDYPCDRPCQAYPAGLTRADDVARLLPNHTLETRPWIARRYWPTAEEVGTSADPKRELVTVAEEIGGLLEALTSHHDLYLTLTAGQDSRLIVACASERVLKQSEFIRFRYGNSRGDEIDQQIASHISRRQSLTHRVLDVEPVPEQVLVNYLRRIGVAGGAGKARDFWVSAGGLDLQRAFVTGFGGEVLRGYYQFASVAESGDAAHLLKMCELPVTPRFVEAMRIWREGLLCFPVEVVSDLLYHEIRGGCWAMPHQYGIANFAASLTPFSSRPLLSACMRLPREMRPGVMQKVIALRRPDLQYVPINDFIGLRRLARRLVRNRFWSFPGFQ